MSVHRLHDSACCGAIARSPDMLVPWYLMASYLYYHKDESLLSDPLFDSIARRLLTEWDTINHWHKGVINKDDLSAGTCLLVESEYPQRTRCAAHQLLGR